MRARPAVVVFLLGTIALATAVFVALRPDVLGYVSTKPAKPGEFRAISVRVARPDVRVVGRKGHTGPPAASPRTLSAESVTEGPAIAGVPGRGTRGSRVERPAAEAAAGPVGGVLPELSRHLRRPPPSRG